MERFCVVVINTGNGDRSVLCKEIMKTPMEGFVRLVSCEGVQEDAMPELMVETLTIREDALKYFAEGSRPIESATPTLVEDEEDDEEDDEFDGLYAEDPEPEPVKPKRRRKKK